MPLELVGLSFKGQARYAEKACGVLLFYNQGSVLRGCFKEKKICNVNLVVNATAILVNTLHLILDCMKYDTYHLCEKFVGCQWR